MKCEVCNREVPTVVCSSSCGGSLSFAYCHDCLSAGLEPYSAITGMGIYYNDMCKSYKEKILLPTLKFYGKTVEEFNDDVERTDNSKSV